MKAILFTPLFILLFCGAYAQNQDVSGGLVFEGEPYMVSDPSNPQHLVIAWMGTVPLTHTSIKVVSSTNGGLTWSTPAILPHMSPNWGSADVSMAFDHSGNLYACYIDFRESPDSGGVYVAKSADGGLTFGTPSLVISGFADGTKYPLDRPWLTIGHASGGAPDTMYVTTKPAPWVPAPNRPYFTKSYDYGATWSAWRYIDSTGYLVGNFIQAPMAAPAVDSGGRFHCVYPTYVASVSVYPRYIMATLGPANSFSYDVAYTITGGSSIDTNAKAGQHLICDPTNNKHYASLCIENFHGDLDVFCAETVDGGVTWSSLARVNDDAISNGKMQDLVWCDFDEYGNIIAAWRDRRNASGTGYDVPSEIWGAVKWKDSSAFSSNFRISDTIVAYDSILARPGNDFMNVVMAQDTMSAVWGDMRTGVLNIWFQRRAMLTGITTGIQKITSEKIPSVNIYPNPADNYLTIEGEGVTEIILNDINGKEVLKHIINKEKTIIDISYLPAGTYLATIKTKDGIFSDKITRK